MGDNGRSRITEEIVKVLERAYNKEEERVVLNGKKPELFKI